VTPSRPILFTADEVRATLEGRKTQVRRPVEPQPIRASPTSRLCWSHDNSGSSAIFGEDVAVANYMAIRCPFGHPRDLLWAQETWAEIETKNQPEKEAWYRADKDWDVPWLKWSHAKDMPRWACRLWLRITDVRVERIKECSFADWKADFAPSYIEEEKARASFVGYEYQREFIERRWNTIHAPKGFGWDTNPWVWVVEFERTEAP